MQWVHDTFIEATNGWIGAFDIEIFPPCLGHPGAYKEDVIVVELSPNAIVDSLMDDIFRALTTLPNKPLVVYLYLTSVQKHTEEEEWLPGSPHKPTTLAPKHGVTVLGH